MLTDSSRREHVIQLRQRAVAWTFLSLLVAALPFFSRHPLLFLVGGALAGLTVAISWERATALAKQIDVDRKYKQQEIADCHFTDRTFLGYGMDFAQYRDVFDQQERKTGRMDPGDVDELHQKLARDHMGPIFLSDSDITRHVLVFGATGLGKTELYLSVIQSAVLKRGGGCLIFDAKGDEKLIVSVYAMAKEFNRAEDVLFINFNKPDYSHTYNPLLQSSTRELVSTLMKLFDKRGEQFFRDTARAALTAAILAIKAQPQRVAFNFSDLAVLFSNYHELEALYEKMPADHPERDVVWSFLARFNVSGPDGSTYIDTKRYNELLTGLSNKMLDFSHSEHRYILNDYSPDIELKSAILQSKIIVVVVPALSDKEGVELFGKLFLGDFARAVGQIQQERNKAPFPFVAFLDEYASFADESHIELWQQARSANVSLWPAVQGKGFMAKVGPSFMENIAGNNWHHIYFDVRDPETRDYAVRLAGTIIRRYRSETESESFGYGHSNAELGAIRQENKGRSISQGQREMKEDLLQATDFSMPEGNAILIAKRGTYRMVLPMVEFKDPLPRLEEIKLARFEKHNVVGLQLMRNLSKRGK